MCSTRTVVDRSWSERQNLLSHMLAIQQVDTRPLCKAGELRCWRRTRPSSEITVPSKVPQ